MLTNVSGRIDKFRIKPAIIFDFLQVVLGEAPWVSEIMLMRKLAGPGLAGITSNSYISFPLVVTTIFRNSTFCA